MRNILFSCLFLFCCFSMAGKVPSKQKIRLTDNWEYLKGDLGGIWEVVLHREVRRQFLSGKRSLFPTVLMPKMP